MQSKLSNSLQIEAANLKQKAKVNWLTSGDMLTKIFYAKMSGRKYCNDIGKLLDANDTFINVAPHLEKEANKYFSDPFNFEGNPGIFPNITPKCLLHANSEEILLALICLDDIKIIISLLKMTKALAQIVWGQVLHWEEYFF